MINLDDLKFEGVTFVAPSGNYHSYYDFCMMLKSDITFTSPVPKTHIVEDVWGIDSKLDFTDSFGPVRYDNITITMNFTILDGSLENWFQNVGHRIYNALHGKVVRIIQDWDKDWYWEGRASVNWNKEGKFISEVSVVIDAFPYKRSVKPCIYKATISSGTTKTIALINDAMPTNLKITAASDCTLTFDSKSYTLYQGENTSDFELVEGKNQIAITGGGSVILEWITGRLM